jgi:hypothetical protein
VHTSLPRSSLSSNSRGSKSRGSGGGSQGSEKPSRRTPLLRSRFGAPACERYAACAASLWAVPMRLSLPTRPAQRCVERDGELCVPADESFPPELDAFPPAFAGDLQPRWVDCHHPGLTIDQHLPAHGLHELGCHRRRSWCEPAPRKDAAGCASPLRSGSRPCTTCGCAGPTRCCAEACGSVFVLENGSLSDLARTRLGRQKQPRSGLAPQEAPLSSPSNPKPDFPPLSP